MSPTHHHAPPRFGALAGIQPPESVMPRPAVAVDPDASLIAACQQMVKVQADFDELFSRRKSIADERATAGELDCLYARQAVAESGLVNLPAPTSLRGARAVAETVAALWPKDRDGNWDHDTAAQWFALGLVEYLLQSGENT